jgi:YNFM family putative membrane transporter
MSTMSHVAPVPRMGPDASSTGVLARFLVIALTAFLTVVDLFATQAILPSLTRAYGVSPAAMGSAVNASTLGMAIAGLCVAIFSRRIDRRRGILISLAILAIPTALLAAAPNLAVFTMLRIAQGLCMASAFTLTLAYLGEHPNAVDAATASAAYITGNVASNFIGRFVSAAVADHFGLASNFYFFAALNLAGAVLVYFTVHTAPRPLAASGAPWRASSRHGRCTCAIRGCAPPSASDFASCSPSSGPSPTSISCWCVRPL